MGFDTIDINIVLINVIKEDAFFFSPTCNLSCVNVTFSNKTLK